jgi:hypothetical protein
MTRINVVAECEIWTVEASKFLEFATRQTQKLKGKKTLVRKTLR